MPEEAAQEKPAEGAAPSGGGGLLGGIKGWIIVIAITLVQAAFWIAMMIIREPGAQPDPAEQARSILENPEMIQSRVELNNFAATVPGPGGDLRPLSFNAVLELRYQDEERRPNAPRPTLVQIEQFRYVVQQLESKIRDHMNTFLVGQSFANLSNERGPDLVKNELMRYVNNELERYDYGKNIPDNISRRRVTNVLLPSWTLM